MALGDPWLQRGAGHLQQRGRAAGIPLASASPVLPGWATARPQGCDTHSMAQPHHGQPWLAVMSCQLAKQMVTSRTQAECPACLPELLPAGHSSWRGAASPAVLPERSPRMQHHRGAATTAALLAFGGEIRELGTHVLPGGILPGKCWRLCWGAELMYSHGLLPAQRQWKPLSTGRAGLRDPRGSSYRQELPPMPGCLPSTSCLPCSHASLGSTHRDPARCLRVGQRWALVLLSAVCPQEGPCPIHPPQTNPAEE